jgi:hypothetical protein
VIFQRFSQNKKEKKKQNRLQNRLIITVLER